MVNQNGGKTTVLLVVLIIISLGLAGGVFYLFQQEQAKSVKLQNELDETTTRCNFAEGEVKRLKTSLEQKDVELKDAQNKVDTLTGDLKQAQEVSKSAQDELGRVKSDLATQQSLRVKLEGELNLAQTALNKAQAQLKDLESKRNVLETKIGSLEQKTQKNESGDVELGTIVVEPEAKASASALANPTAPKPISAVANQKSSGLASEGKVLVVNKEYNFAVINLGAKDGVAIGDVFYIYHSNKYIGDITLEKVQDSMAAAGFSSPNIKNKIAEGDRVVKKKK